MTPTLGSIGAEIDINLRAGDTLGPFIITLSDTTGQLINLTGATLSGAISRLGTDDGDTALTVAAVAPLAGGTLSVSLSATATASLAGGDFFTLTAAYAWKVVMVDTGGKKTTLCFGKVYVASGTLV